MVEFVEQVQEQGGARRAPEEVGHLLVTIQKVKRVRIFRDALLRFAYCPKMCEAGIENPKKNVWLNKSIYPLNKTFLLGQKAKNTFLRKRQNPKKNVFI